MGIKIEVNENNGIINTGDYSVNKVCLNNHDDLNWDDIEKELNKLLETTNSAVLENFALQSKHAVKQKNYKKLISAAKKIGQFGLEFLKEASFNLLAEIVAKALFL